MAKRDVTFGIETTLNKSNIIKSSAFHMDEGDILHIIYRDHTGALVTIALVSADGDVEVVQVIPTTTPAPTTTVATTTIATTTLTTTTPTTTPTTTYTTTTTVEPNPIVTYGALYNWYAATDPREICAEDWHVPTKAEFDTLITYLGGDTIAGGKLKEMGLIYWNTPNTGATNEVGFNARGYGERSNLGVFGFINEYTQFITTSEITADTYYCGYLSYDSESFDCESGGWKKSGQSIRPIKDSTFLSDGEKGTYTDPSGFVYETICIGTQEWVSSNIITQHYRNGDPIPNVTDNATWMALTSGAMCYYNNNPDAGYYTTSTTSTAAPTTTEAPLLDIDGNEYTTVTIGSQEWIVENYRAKHYRNGSPISYLENSSTISNLVTGWTNVNFDTFTTSGSNITSAIEAAGSHGTGLSNSFSILAEDVLSYNVTLTVVLGTAPSLMIYRGGVLVDTVILSNGVNIGTYTCTLAGNYQIGFYSPLSGCSFSAVCVVQSDFNMGWDTDLDGAYCYYENTSSNETDYGLFYNWHAIDNSSGLAYLERAGVEELGWRVPTSTEIDELIASAGGITVAGGALKEVGTTHWNDPNVDATNSTGFTGRGAGDRAIDGTFENGQYLFSIWSSTEGATGYAYSWIACEDYHGASYDPASSLKRYGLSVRLVKDLTPATTTVAPSTTPTTTLAATTTATPVYFLMSTTRVGTFTLTLGGLGDISVIDWGDGQLTNYTLTGGNVSFNHTYTTAGTKSIIITGGEHITYISAEGQGVTAVSVTAGMINIEEIYLSNNSLTSFTTHPEWTALEVLDLGTNSLNTLTTRSQWTALRILDVSNNNLTALTTYAQWVALDSLIVDYNSLTSLTTYSAWVSLDTLSAQNNDLANLVAYTTWGGTTINFNASYNNISDSTAINNILGAINSSTKTTGSVNLAGGTNAVATGSGLTAITSLEAKGIDVTVNEIAEASYYVATPAQGGNDSNPGTYALPFATWQKGFSVLAAGDVLYIRGGTYYPSSTYGFGGYCGVYWANVSGTASNTIKVANYPGEVPILDCRNVTNSGYNHYGIVTSNCFYWEFEGLRVCNVTEAAYPYYGRAWVLNASSHVTYTLCEAYSCADGFVTNGFCDYIYWTNCDSHDHVDTRDGGDLANGWTTGGYGSGGNFHYYFEGCRAWHNSDDGYDFLNADGASHGGYITMNNCWAFDNGHSGGNGVGFKFGGWIDGTPDGGNQRIITNCLSWNNSNNGYDENVGAGAKMDCVLYHNVAYHNCLGYAYAPDEFRWTSGFAFNYPQDSTHPASHILRNNISFGNLYWDANTPVSKCTVSNNSWPSGGTASTIASTSDFISVDPTGTDGDRNSDGSLPNPNGFLKLANSSDMIRAGVVVSGFPTDADGNAWENPPSMGAYEVTSSAITLTVSGQTFTTPYNTARIYDTNFSFLNNLVSLAGAGHYGLLAGAESTDSYNNNLDGAIITGNKLIFAGTDTDPHGIMLGYNTNQVVKYNYINAATYGVVYKSSSSGVANMENGVGVCAYNIFYNNIMGIRIKGFNGTLVYNNVFYNARSGSNAQIYITNNPASGGGGAYASTGTKIKNNIFYITSGCQAVWVESGCQSGLECDYNIYYCAGSNPVFAYLGSVYTWTQWRALGYDAHSVVMNPGFADLTNFVPASRLDYGTNLGTTYDDGLSTTATWVVGSTPTTSQQNGTWQVGARVYGTVTTTAAPATTEADLSIDYLTDETYLSDETILID